MLQGEWWVGWAAVVGSLQAGGQNVLGVHGAAATAPLGTPYIPFGSGLFSLCPSCSFLCPTLQSVTDKLKKKLPAYVI